MKFALTLVPVMWTPFAPLPEMMFRAAAVVPPMVLLWTPLVRPAHWGLTSIMQMFSTRRMPLAVLGRAAAPAALVPMKFP